MAQSLEIGIAEDQSVALSAAANVAFTAEEANAALSVLPFSADSLFVPPGEALAILGPGWRLWFRDRATGDLVEVYADPGFTLQHSQPVKLDRFGTLPAIYVPLGVDIEVTVENQFGVFRGEFRYPDVPLETTGIWQFDNSTVIADPGTGNVRTDAVPASSTTAAFSAVTFDGVDLSALMRTLRTNDFFYAQTASGTGNWALFTLTGAPTDFGSWFSLPISHADGNGVVNKGDQLIVRFGYG